MKMNHPPRPGCRLLLILTATWLFPSFLVARTYAADNRTGEQGAKPVLSSSPNTQRVTDMLNTLVSLGQARVLGGGGTSRPDQVHADR